MGWWTTLRPQHAAIVLLTTALLGCPASQATSDAKLEGSPADAQRDFGFPPQRDLELRPDTEARRDAAGPLVAQAIFSHDQEDCALLVDGRIACWLTYGTLIPAIVPGQGQARRLLDYDRSLCALVPRDEVRCRDAQSNGWRPLAVKLPPISKLAWAYSHACALTQSGDVLCWGENDDGELGAGRPGGTTAEPRRALLPRPARALAVTGFRSCAVVDDGRAFCWGAAWTGALSLPLGDPQVVPCGPFDHPCAPSPAQMPGIDDAIDITTWGRQSCALLARGTVSCWGNNHNGTLGLGHSDPVLGPHEIPSLTGVRKLAQVDATCALLDNGHVACWGSNKIGQLGLGLHAGPEQCGNPPLDFACSKRPREVPGIENAVDIAQGRSHFCVLLADGRVACWGEGYLPAPSYISGFGGVP